MMERLIELIEQARRSTPLEWTVQGTRISVALGGSGRKQVISVSRVDGYLRFRSIVLEAREVTWNTRRWRELARHAWRRNAEKQMVCFCFDERDRLIGQILQPAESLDVEELVLYVNVLARECDEYEYRLSGADDH